MIDRLNYCPCNKTWGNCTACYLDLARNEIERREKIWASYDTNIKCCAVKEPEPVELPTCQIKNLDTGELKTMTREAAKKLQAELGAKVNWFDVAGNEAGNLEFEFNVAGIYTYKLRGTVKLTIDDEPAKMLTPAQCEAERLARIDTHYLNYQSKYSDFKIEGDAIYDAHSEKHCPEYRLIRKQPKQVSWKDVPVGVVVTYRSQLYPMYRSPIMGYPCVITTDGLICQDFLNSDFELAPASEQPWLIYIQGETDLASLKGVEIELLITSNYTSPSIANTEHLSAYPAKLDNHQSIKAYRITGLAEGYCYPKENI